MDKPCLILRRQLIRAWMSLVCAVSLSTALYAQKPDEKADWFPFKANEDFSPSVISMHDWLDAPAGKHGFVQINGKDFAFEDGTAVKFWGVNITSNDVFPAKEKATHWANYLSKYGVNSVRLHKFTHPGITGMLSTELDTEKWDKLDFFHEQLRASGIYAGWSPIYGHKPRPGDKPKLLAYNEIMKAGEAHLKGSTIGLVNFASDLQELSIQLTVNMLNHRNPYTGLRYADDPALSFIELQNEDNIFFATTHNWVMACPTYKRLFCEQFSDWLKKKYGSHENLVAAWGEGAIDAWPEFQSGEQLDKRNIYPLAHHGYLSQKTMGDPNVRKRLLDTAHFLYETQRAFYTKYIKAIRATGYKGPIVASGWQAGDDVAHYYNLHTDYLAGIIDRHNYYGGNGGHNLAPGKLDNTPMVSKPGSGLLGTGMQAVLDRPFVLSEWMSKLPNEWTAESAPIVATYGMGLQGWDASYVYASNAPGIVSTMQSPEHGVYNADSPLHIGLYPALARMVYRGDVQEGDVISNRKVHIPSLATDEGFAEKAEQGYDVKRFSGTVSEESLAAGRVVVEFTDKPDDTDIQLLAALPVKETGKVVQSNTGQLIWHRENKGFFTIHTPGTRGVVGFSGNQLHNLGDIALRVENPFAVVLVCSLEKDIPIDKSRHLLVTTVARARNSGMKYNKDGSELLQVGKGPIVMEPVIATLFWPSQLKSKKAKKNPVEVYVLDHAGRRTGQKIEPGKEAIVLDGTKHKTIYYEIVLPERGR